MPKAIKLYRIKILFEQLENYLQKYGDSSIRNQYIIVKNTVEALNSAETSENRFNYAVHSYKALFTGKGGLTEFYVYHDDFDKRQSLNQPLEHITDELWHLLKEYV